MFWEEFQYLHSILIWLTLWGPALALRNKREALLYVYEYRLTTIEFSKYELHKLGFLKIYHKKLHPPNVSTKVFIWGLFEYLQNYHIFINHKKMIAKIRGESNFLK